MVQVQIKVFQDIKLLLEPPPPHASFDKIVNQLFVESLAVLNTLHFSQKQTRQGFPLFKYREL